MHVLFIVEPEDHTLATFYMISEHALCFFFLNNNVERSIIYTMRQNVSKENYIHGNCSIT